jgi:hypothetical protein
MISFVVITDTPARLANFLESRGIIEQKTDPLTEETYYIGVRPGMEWVKVPNPIQTAPGSGTPGEVGYAPPTYDDRAVFLVKFAWESESEKADAFRDWVIANSSVVNAPVNYLINGEHAGSARKITGEQVWLVHVDPDRFGVWQ